MVFTKIQNKGNMACEHATFQPVQEMFLMNGWSLEETNECCFHKADVAGESLGKSPLADCILRKLQTWDAYHSGYLPMENLPCNASATGKIHTHRGMPLGTLFMAH